MKKLLPLFAVLIILAVASYFVLNSAPTTTKSETKEQNKIVLEEFNKARSCEDYRLFYIKPELNDQL